MILKKYKYVVAIVFSLFLTNSVFSAELPTVNFVTFNQKPVSYHENDHAQGVAVEIVEQVFKRLNQPITIRVQPFPRALKTVQNNQATAIFSIVKSKEREQNFIYSDEVLLYQNAVLMVNKNNPIQFNGDLQGLADYKFAVLKDATYGSQWQHAINEKYITQLKALNNHYQSLMMLAKNRVDIVIGSEISLIYKMKEMNYQGNMKLLYPPIEVVPTYLVFAKTANNQVLKNLFDQALKSLKTDGTYDKILKAYTL